MCLQVRHFDITLLRKFTNHNDFALTVRYRSPDTNAAVLVLLSKNLNKKSNENKVNSKAPLSLEDQATKDTINCKIVYYKEFSQPNKKTISSADNSIQVLKKLNSFVCANGLMESKISRCRERVVELTSSILEFHQTLSPVPLCYYQHTEFLVVQLPD